MDYNKILDENILNESLFRAGIRLASINDQVDAELSRRIYRYMLKHDEYYRIEAKRRVRNLKL
ncbi:MAG: hypothetical protein Q8L27_03645 [archaeon]|nr:hypothetical protein [archaeon]